jgi:hypothetical protein
MVKEEPVAKVAAFPVVTTLATLVLAAFNQVPAKHIQIA